MGSSTIILFVTFFTAIVLIRLLQRFLFRQHKAEAILHTLFTHFMNQNEKAIEFRIIESKAKKKAREFEVKTIRQNYYTVVIKGLKVISIEPIGRFSILEENSYVRGVIDPVLLDRFEITVKEFTL